MILMLGRGENRAWCWGGEKVLMLGRGEGIDVEAGR